MNATAAMPRHKKPQVQKEDAMWLQKEMINRNYHRARHGTRAGQEGRRDFRRRATSTSC